MKTTLKTLLVIGSMSAGVAHAGIIADAIARHEAKNAAASASAAAPAASSTAAGQTGQATQAAAVITYAERTHAAAKGVVNHQLSNSQQCAELVHQGKLSTSTMAQYKCILLGPQAALAGAQKASGVVASK